MTSETPEAVHPKNRPALPSKEKAELLLALLCMMLLFAAFGFSELDSDYVTSTRLTAAIQRIVGHTNSKASITK